MTEGYPGAGVELRACRHEGCQRPTVARGFCDTHYRQFRKHGTTHSIFRSPTERLHEYSHEEPNTGCTLWTGKTTKGYGHIRVGRRMVYAHRLAPMRRSLGLFPRA